MKLGCIAQDRIRFCDLGVVVAYGFWTGTGGASVYSVGAFSVYTLDARFSIHSNKSSSLTLTALSSTEWEYMALFHALKELIWLHHFLKEIGYDVSKQNTIYCDNQGASALSHNPKHHARTYYKAYRHSISLRQELR